MRKMTLFETEKFGICIEVKVIYFTYIVKALRIYKYEIRI